MEKLPTFVYVLALFISLFMENSIIIKIRRTGLCKELIARGGMYSLAAYITAGHHAGLPDKGTDADDAGRGTLCGREKKKIPNYQAYKDEIKIRCESEVI